MHTIKDVTEHLLQLITGREDSQKVRAFESALGRSFVLDLLHQHLNSKVDKVIQHYQLLHFALLVMSAKLPIHDYRVLLFPHILTMYQRSLSLSHT